MTFLEAYTLRIVGGLQNWYDDNYDEWRFGPKPENESPPAWHDEISASIQLIEPYLSWWERVYADFQDDESRETFVSVMTFRALGHRRIRFPLSTPAYWDHVWRLNETCDPDDIVNVDVYPLHLMRLQSLGIPVSVYTYPQSALNEFILEQYRSNEVFIADGDVVVDCGACWGDSSLNFALRGGNRVYAIEFEQDNLKVLRRNLELNLALADRIQIIEAALWSNSTELAFSAHGQGTYLLEGQGVKTKSMDDLDLGKVDFLKMDIEGSEVNALQGAEKLIKRWHPKLAIAVYHRLYDLPIIMDYLRQFGYKFWLRHFSIHTEETILFARV